MFKGFGTGGIHFFYRTPDTKEGEWLTAVFRAQKYTLFDNDSVQLCKLTKHINF